MPQIESLMSYQSEHIMKESIYRYISITISNQTSSQMNATTEGHKIQNLKEIWKNTFLLVWHRLLLIQYIYITCTSALRAVSGHIHWWSKQPRWPGCKKCRACYSKYRWTSLAWKVGTNKNIWCSLNRPTASTSFTMQRYIFLETFSKLETTLKWPQKVTGTLSLCLKWISL